MSLLRVFSLSICLVLGACASQDGLYEPRCIAYEGDRVSLSEERFEWHKFTDQREIDKQGEIIDPFPGYPKAGTFENHAGRIAFHPDDGSIIADHFVVEYLDEWFLMPQTEHQQFLIENEISSCALRRKQAKN